MVKVNRRHALAISWLLVVALFAFSSSFLILRLPIGIAIHIIETYPSYFSFNYQKDEWANEHSQIELAALGFFSQKLLRDWITQESRMDASRNSLRKSGETGVIIDSVASSIHKAVLSQRHLDEAPFENWASHRRLILGWGYCDHINRLLASTLAEIYDEAVTWNTRYPKTGVSTEIAGKTTHTLAAIELAGVRVFADAWSSVHSFIIDDTDNLPIVVRSYYSIPVGPPEKKFNFQRQAKGMLIPVAYTNGWASETFRSSSGFVGKLDFQTRLETSKLLTKYGDDPEMLYLLGRLFYLYQFFDESKRFFLTIARTGCEESMECRLARKFLEYSFE